MSLISSLSSIESQFSGSICPIWVHTLHDGFRLYSPTRSSSIHDYLHFVHIYDFLLSSAGI